MSSDLDAKVAQLQADPLFKDFPADHLRANLTEDPSWPDRYRELARKHAAERAEITRRRLDSLVPLFADLDAAGLLSRSETSPRGYLPRERRAAAYPLLLEWYPRLEEEQA